MSRFLRSPFPFVLSLAAVALWAGCDAGDPVALTPGASPSEARWNHATPRPSAHFRAHLAGSEEVPAVDTNARGQALFRLSEDGTELSYRLIVADLEDVLMSHIHLAPAGANGGIVVWLYPDGPPPQLIEGRSSGVLAEGVITAGALVGVLAGEPLSALIAQLESGGAYVNVHTTAHPGGEIRGQIR